MAVINNKCSAKGSTKLLWRHTGNERKTHKVVRAEAHKLKARPRKIKNQIKAAVAQNKDDNMDNACTGASHARAMGEKVRNSMEKMG